MISRLDELDLEIIRSLQQDGRRSNVDIARDLGVAESTVRKRLERLLEEEMVSIVATPNLNAIGLSVHTLIFIQVELAHADETANRVASFPQVRSVTYTTGEYDMVVDAVFADNDALLHFLSTQLASLDNVIKATTVHVLQDIKTPHQWQIPPSTPCCVLVVDCDTDFVRSTRSTLEQDGLLVLDAPDADTGLQLMRRHRPGLVILDVMMNSLLQGMTATWTIRADQELRSTPLLMVSSIPNSEYADSFPTDEYLPIDGFVCKPIPPQRLREEVRRLLRRKRRDPR